MDDFESTVYLICWKTGCETESGEVSRSLPWTAIKTNNLSVSVKPLKGILEF